MKKHSWKTSVDPGPALYLLGSDSLQLKSMADPRPWEGTHKPWVSQDFAQTMAFWKFIIFDKREFTMSLVSTALEKEWPQLLQLLGQFCKPDYYYILIFNAAHPPALPSSFTVIECNLAAGIPTQLSLVWEEGDFKSTRDPS